MSKYNENVRKNPKYMKFTEKWSKYVKIFFTYSHKNPVPTYHKVWAKDKRRNLDANFSFVIFLSFSQVSQN